MSHFVVMVIGEDVEGQLAPYDEQTEHKEYLTFEEEEIENFEKYTTETYELVEVTPEEIAQCRDRDLHVIDGKHYANTFAECFRVPGSFGLSFGGGGSLSHKVDKKRILKIPFTTVFPTFEEYMEEYCGCEARDPEKKMYGTWRNTNSKWDWYLVGGRWSGLLKLKNPKASGASMGKKSWTNEKDPDKYGYVDSALLKDIDFEGMAQEQLDKATKAWNDAEEDSNKETSHRYWHYGIHAEDTKKSFIGRREAFTTFAVVKDGKWYEKGAMGWWGVVHNEKNEGEWEKQFSSLLKELDPDTRITIVDCHI